MQITRTDDSYYLHGVNNKKYKYIQLKFSRDKLFAYYKTDKSDDDSKYEIEIVNDELKLTDKIFLSQLHARRIVRVEFEQLDETSFFSINDYPIVEDGLQMRIAAYHSKILEAYRKMEKYGRKETLYEIEIHAMKIALEKVKYSKYTLPSSETCVKLPYFEYETFIEPLLMGEEVHKDGDVTFYDPLSFREMVKDLQLSAMRMRETPEIYHYMFDTAKYLEEKICSENPFVVAIIHKVNN